MKKTVSIPHRYGKNDIDSVVYVYSDGFPFLIGTVRTFDYVSYVDDCPVFPFLIGTVRTILSSIFLLVSISFPFLIGTVRTYKTYYKRTRILCLFPFLIGTVRTLETQVVNLLF